MAQARPFDLVITELYMPRMDGLALTRALRGLLQYHHVPILVLTTESGESFKQQGTQAGATGWLGKPFDPDKLVRLVSKVMSPSS